MTLQIGSDAPDFEADSTEACDYSADTQEFLMTAGWIVAWPSTLLRISTTTAACRSARLR